MLLRTRIMAGVMAGLAIVILCLIAGRFYADNQSEARYQRLAIDDQKILWQKIVEGQINGIKAGTSGLTRNRKAMQALADRDHDALGEAIIGVFNRMSTRQVISRLHITDLSGTIVYSSVDGSAMSPIAKAAIDRGEVVSGLVQDLDRTVQVAVAMPLFHRGKPVGVGLLMRDAGAAVTDLQRSISSEIAMFGRDKSRLAQTDAALFDQILPAGIEQPAETQLKQSRFDIDSLAYTTTPTLLSDYAGDQLGILISARDESDLITKKWWADTLSYGLTAALLCLVVGSLYVYIFHNFKALSEIARSIGLMADGEAVKLPGGGRQDELGELVRSTDKIYQKALQATRVRTALDDGDTMILVANRHHKITYVNNTLSAYFRQQQDEIAKSLPGFSWNELIGSDISKLLQRSDDCQQFLRQLREPHRINISLGNRRLRRTVKPIRGNNNEHLGTVMEWVDATAEIDVQGQIDRVIAAASKGDFTDRITIENENTAYASIATGINRLNEQVETAIDDVAAVLESIANGELDRRISSNYQGKLGELKEHVNNTATQLTCIVSDIKAAANEVTAAADEIGSGTKDLADRTEQAASNLEETASATEELAATVKQNADNSANANQLAGTANTVATRGGGIVERAVSAMSGIDQSAAKITEIISVIDEIAFQTNLLALNASVEAARAGEAGKGFAVVAQEVRQLAQRSAQAASDIKVLIQDSNGQVKDGVALVNQAGEALTEILTSIGDVATIVEAISSASQEQAFGVQEINSSITSLDEVTQQNAALVEESTASAVVLGDQAKKLTEAMTFFKIGGSNGISQTEQLKQHPAELAPSKKLPAVANCATETGWDEF